MSSSVISKDKADSVSVTYEPNALDATMSQQVRAIATEKGRAKDFRLDSLVSQMTGIDEIEKKSRQKGN